MPFVTQKRRKALDKKGAIAVESVGDICYLYYKEMVKQWKKEPRWTTAHNIYKEMIDEVQHSTFGLGSECAKEIEDEKRSYELAWQVFFIKYVMPYEDEKEIENGTI